MCRTREPRRSTFPAVGTEPLFAGSSDGHNHADTSDGVARDITGIGCILPDRQPRARRPPSVDNLRIRPRLTRDPFDEIEHQGIGGLVHVHWSLPLRSCLAWTLSTPPLLRKLRARASP